ncbi:MAG TPA: hypothetical protein VEH04_14930 [Verrucomicrobiae bacterium]|nr:hypothetical protein [Verrucomicrobiae bacterium]
MKDSILHWRFHALRRLERKLAAPGLYRVLAPFAWWRAFRKTLFKPPDTGISVPDCVRPPSTRRSARNRLMVSYLNQYLRLFQDRLSEPKWAGRCAISGIHHLEEACQTRRGVILAFCHFGPYANLRIWLRAFGTPGAIVVGPNAEKRPRWQQFLDVRAGDSDHPTIIPLDQLREAAAILSRGIPLLIALDAERGKQMHIPFQSGWTFRMATGAMRMAVNHDAALIPCTIINRGPWRHQIELSAPVPATFLETRARWPEAGKYLLDKLMPHVKAHPAQCDRNLLNCFIRLPRETVESDSRLRA